MQLCIFLVVCLSTVRLTVLCLFSWASWSVLLVAWDVGGNLNVFQFDLWRCFSSWEGRPCGKTWPFRVCCLAQLLTCLHTHLFVHLLPTFWRFTYLPTYLFTVTVRFDSISLLLLLCRSRRRCFFKSFCLFVCLFLFVVVVVVFPLPLNTKSVSV